MRREDCTPEQLAKHKRGGCVTPHCRRKHRTRLYKRKTTHHYLCCNTCYRRAYRQNYPYRYFFDNLRHRAKERGHDFTLTVDDIIKLFREAGVSPGGNKHRFGASIDRIKGEHGYHSWNVQVLTLSENSRKEYCDYWKEKAA